ncbi:MAG: amidohydrolase family protein [Acidobacteriota bacterium]
MRNFLLILSVVSVLALACLQPAIEASAQMSLLAEINQIKAIDNHAHPQRLTAAGEIDTEWDALPFEAYEFTSLESLPIGLRPTNLKYIEAWRALFGYKHNDMSEEHVRELVAAKQRVMREQGDRYPAWVLDRIGIGTMLANRVAMGRGLAAPRYRWVSYVDALMYPLQNSALRKWRPRYGKLYDGIEQMQKRYLNESGVKAVPPTMDEYLSKVVVATLERHKQGGALAVKFEAAYLRRLDFDDVAESDARSVYARYAKGGEASLAEYKKLQDYLFRYIAREAGRLGLAVHIHVSAGAGAQFELSGANPLLLDAALSDAALTKTNFVIVHGGWPFTKEVAFLLNKPNIYADFSAQTFLLSPRKLSEVIRDWLELYPEKALFGTDAFQITPEIGWEEAAWFTTATAREALAMALTGMIDDGLITRERASELARMVMRENAIKLYGLKTQ